jgi:5-methylcytosine-specific restriction endonuclease McrA
LQDIHSDRCGEKMGTASTTRDPKQIPQDHHTERQWQRKFFGMGAKCYYCGLPLLLKDATRDHRIPRCRGGSDSIKNIVPACLLCNQRKGWRTEAEFWALHPAFAQNPQLLAGKTNIEPTPLPQSTPNLELINNPHLLAQLRREEGMTSWAWRFPA